MTMSGKTITHLGKAKRLYTLLCLVCFFIPAVWMLRGDAVFGVETEEAVVAEDTWKTEEAIVAEDAGKTEEAVVTEDAGKTELPTEAAKDAGSALQEPDATCSIFIYICGSNLESKYGLASENIDELLGADIPDSTTVIIETGGTSRWWSTEWIAEDTLQRYIIRDHQLELQEEMENASMGSAPVFGDYLRWGQENYWADRNILVLWDHGGSSAEGVCYDENFGYDYLNRAELSEAFDRADLPERFDLICLDTCYMGSLANASLFSHYGRYMTASQTIVPGPGMDYKTLVERSSLSGLEELGKELCDTFMTKSAETGRADEAQLAFYDLDAASLFLEILAAEL